jgi:hypothetical protein
MRQHAYVRPARRAARALTGSLTLTDGGTSDQVTTARIMVSVAAKSSADTARRVADGRQRSAEAGSYGGGRRPFGYWIDPDAPKGKKTLIMVPAEETVIQRAADAILAEIADDRKSLAFLARELRAGDVPTVSGGAVPHGVLDGADAAERLTLVPVTLAKGLEFDHVIVVEPAAIARAEARGLQRLYVALTRAVSRLTILHAEPLPDLLR